MAEISIDNFDSYLESRGYDLIKRLDHSRIVNIVIRNIGVPTVIKRDIAKDNMFPQTLVENKILEKFRGLDRLPKKIRFKNNLIKNSKKSFSIGKTMLEDYFLEEEYIKGEIYNCQQLSTAEEQKIIDLMKTFHKEGYSRLDFKRSNNFIFTPKNELYYIDSGWCINKDNPEFKEELKEDLRHLEKLLKKSVSAQGVI